MLPLWSNATIFHSAPNERIPNVSIMFPRNFFALLFGIPYGHTVLLLGNVILWTPSFRHVHHSAWLYSTVSKLSLKCLKQTRHDSRCTVHVPSIRSSFRASALPYVEPAVPWLWLFWRIRHLDLLRAISWPLGLKTGHFQTIQMQLTYSKQELPYSKISD